VIVATSDQNHRDPCLQAMSRRKHVMVEKPLATTVEDAQAIADAAASSGLTVMVGHTLRFDARYTLAHDTIKAGRIGRIGHIYARRSGPVTPIGRRLGGRTSVAFFLGSHDVDVMHWFTGSRVRSVYALARRELLRDLEVDDTIIALLEFDNGVIATLEMSWALPDCPGPRTAPLFEVVGTTGMIQVMAYQQGLTIYTGQGAETPNLFYESWIHGRKVGVYNAEIRHFLDCITTNTRPVVGAEEGLRAVEVVRAIHRSLELGSKVEL
ncbi:MAG: Gfo/Idh/MocA family oxidoreductase, partial [Bacillota bacterium]